MKPKIKKQVLWSLFITLLMVFSIFGIVIGNISNPSKLKYNSHIFYLTNKGWLTTINNKPYYFSYSPKQLENMNISKIILSTLKSKKEIDITSDFNNSFAQAIASNIFSMKQKLPFIYIRDGFTTETPFSKPILTCSNATSFIPVIYIKKSTQTNLSMKNNCITLNAQTPEDLTMLTEYIIYFLLGIIKN